MNKTYCLVVLFVALAQWSCKSPLSNTDITDPSTLQPKIQVIKNTDSTGSIYNYRADIYDQQSRYVELKDAAISVNGEQLILVRSLLGSYYLTDDHIVKYQLNTKYTFIITLSDKSQYTASVTTPSIELSNFVVPLEQVKTQNMRVSWTNPDTSATMNLILAIYFKTDTSAGVQSKNILIPNPRLGTFDLQPSDFLANQGTSTAIDITLNSEDLGQTDSRFYSESRTYSHQMITKSVNLK